MKDYRFKTNINGWLGVILVMGVVLLLFVILKNLYKLFFILAPVFLILTLFLDYRVIAKFSILLYNLLRHKPVLGIIALIFTFIGLPFIAAAMFFNAFMNHRNKVREKSKYSKYIELESSKNEFEKENKIKKPEEKAKSYEDLFD